MAKRNKLANPLADVISDETYNLAVKWILREAYNRNYELVQNHIMAEINRPTGLSVPEMEKKAQEYAAAIQECTRILNAAHFSPTLKDVRIMKLCSYANIGQDDFGDANTKTNRPRPTFIYQGKEQELLIGYEDLAQKMFELKKTPWAYVMKDNLAYTAELKNAKKAFNNFIKWNFDINNSSKKDWAKSRIFKDREFVITDDTVFFSTLLEKMTLSKDCKSYRADDFWNNVCSFMYSTYTRASDKHLSKGFSNCCRIEISSTNKTNKTTGGNGDTLNKNANKKSDRIKIVDNRVSPSNPNSRYKNPASKKAKSNKTSVAPKTSKDNQIVATSDKPAKKTTESKNINRKIDGRGEPIVSSANQIQAESQSKGQEIKSLSKETKEALVVWSTRRCIYNHTVRDVTIYFPIETPSGKTEWPKLQAGYCENCNAYFVLESDFEEILEKGTPQIRIITKEAYRADPDKALNQNWEQMETRLHRLGYNVGQKDGYTDSERHAILTGIIENNGITLYEVKSTINYLIRRNENNSNFEVAIQKYKDDLNFLSTYVPKNAQNVRVDSFVKKVYKDK